jgi:hypothetical protein
MGKGERGGEMRAGVGGGEGRCQSATIHQCHPVLHWRDFSESRILFVDGDSRLSTIGSVR